MFFRFVISLILLAAAPSILAEVRSCVIDGGGTPEQRFCGLAQFTSRMHGMYEEFSQTRTGARALSGSYYSENIFTGDGVNPAGDCHVPVNKTCAGHSGTCTEAAPPPERYTFNTTVGLANDRSHVYPASYNDVTSHCLNGSSANDVCHFYSINHGTLASPGDIPSDQTDYQAMDARITLYVPPGSNSSHTDLNTTQLRSVMDQSGCGTQRFILNNCHSGGMMKMLFDHNGRLIPNRCGTAAAAYHQSARGSATAPVPMTFSNGTQIRIKLNKYDYSEAMFRNLKLGARRLREAPDRYTPYTASLDDAHLYALMSDSTTETPQMSSDFYFDRYYAGRLTNPVGLREINDQIRIQTETAQTYQCFGSNVLGQTYTMLDRLDRTVSGVLNALPGTSTRTIQMTAQGFSNEQITDINNDIALAQEHLDILTSNLCTSYFRPADASLGMSGDCPTSQAEQRTYINQYYQKFRTRRKKAIAEYQKCIKRNGGYSVGCRFEEAKVLRVLGEDRYTRRYEGMLNKLGRTLEFYQKAPKNKIEEYLSLRRCETSAYDQPPASSIQVPPS